MNTRQINHLRWQKPSSDQKRLLGKVVLVIGYDTAVMQNLVRQLAQKGADIALFCWHLSAETARKLERIAQAYGRRLLVIEPMEPGNVAPNQIFEAIID